MTDRPRQIAPKLAGTILALLVAAVVGACSRDTTGVGSEGREYTVAELQRQFSQATSIPAEEFVVPSREQVMARYSAAIAHRSGPTPPFRSVLMGEDILPAITVVMGQIPNFGALTEDDLSVISGDFGGMSRADVIRNLAAIRDLYPAKIRHDVFVELQNPTTVLYDLRQSSDLQVTSIFNSLEQWLLLANPQYARGTLEATAEALAISGSYGANKDGYRWNGLRHALWNVLIAKYTGDWHRSVNSANDWAKTFTDAHEWGSPLPADLRHTYMDLHNNEQGRRYFSSVASVHKTVYGLRQVRAPSLATILLALKKRTENAKSFDKATELTKSKYSSSMVFFRGS